MVDKMSAKKESKKMKTKNITYGECCYAFCL